MLCIVEPSICALVNGRANALSFRQSGAPMDGLAVTSDSEKSDYVCPTMCVCVCVAVVGGVGQLWASVGKRGRMDWCHMRAALLV